MASTARLVTQQPPFATRSETPEPNPQPFPLFHLPAELRDDIYLHALSPTRHLFLTSTKTSRLAITPPTNPPLLRANRQIYHEASSILYTENTICYAVNAHDTMWPIVSEKRLPQHVLQRLQHFCLVLDCAANFGAECADVDFAALEALTSLKTLRVCVVARSATDGERPMEWAVSLLAEVLERVPLSTKVEFGSVPGPIEEFVSKTKEQSKRTNGNFRFGLDMSGQRGPRVEEVPAAELEAGAALVGDERRGCRSGKSEDVYGDVQKRYSVCLARRIGT
ncbi:hypothetical protein MBLNU230_g6886t1 [Neophaeotheca triangularis]